MNRRALVIVGTPVLLALTGLGVAVSDRAGAASTSPTSGSTPAPDRSPATPDASALRFTIGEGPLLEWLRAATPFTVTVGNQLLSTELVLSDPTDLHLKDGLASLRIRAKGRTLPIDQVLQPLISLGYDRSAYRYYGVLSSLPIEIPGLGRIDLKDSVPRFEIPAVLENLWRFADRPVGLNLKIRRLAILDRALEVGAEITFAPISPAGARSAR